MRYRTLGDTGIEVSVQCLGTMMFGSIGNGDHDECVRMVDVALENGINFIDTADMYSAGESEEIVGKALRGRRDEVVLATKVHFQMGEGRNRSGNSRRWIIQACEASLRRLQTDWIDLYQVHRPDPSTDLAETLSVLTDLVHQGKIRAFGCSTFPASEIVEAYYLAERHGLERFRTEQPPYSLLLRGIEATVLPICERFRMGVLTWSPLAWGFLSGRYRKGQPVDLATGRPTIDATRFDPANPETAVKFDVVERFVELASNIDLMLPELALAFPASHRAVTSVIIGPRTMDQLESALKAGFITLDDTVLDRIDEIVPPGTNAYRNEGAWIPPSLSEPLLRRRPLTERAAALTPRFEGVEDRGSRPQGFMGDFFNRSCRLASPISTEPRERSGIRSGTSRISKVTRYPRSTQIKSSSTSTATLGSCPLGASPGPERTTGTSTRTSDATEVGPAFTHASGPCDRGSRTSFAAASGTNVIPRDHGKGCLGSARHPE